MMITTKGRYALRVMADLAAHDNGGYVALKEVCSRQGITVKYVEQIMPYLSRAGYVKSFRGNSGGYRLSMDPSSYTAGDILRSVEGALSPVACLQDDPVQCPRAEECRTLPFWRGLEKVINDYVDSVTLADLAGIKKQDVDGSDTV